MKTQSFRSRWKVVVPTLGLLITTLWAFTAFAQNSADDSNTWTRTELYYGAGRFPVDPAREARWESYVNEVVTPRFPEGLTILEGTGQWRVKEGQTPRRSRTRILILIHENTPQKSQQVDEIRTLWKELTGHQAVLRVSQPAEVSL